MPPPVATTAGPSRLIPLALFSAISPPVVSNSLLSHISPPVEVTESLPAPLRTEPSKSTVCPEIERSPPAVFTTLSGSICLKSPFWSPSESAFAVNLPPPVATTAGPSRLIPLAPPSATSPPPVEIASLIVISPAAMSSTIPPAVVTFPPAARLKGPPLACTETFPAPPVVRVSLRAKPLLEIAVTSPETEKTFERDMSPKLFRARGPVPVSTMEPPSVASWPIPSVPPVNVTPPVPEARTSAPASTVRESSASARMEPAPPATMLCRIVRMSPESTRTSPLVEATRQRSIGPAEVTRTSPLLERIFVSASMKTLPVPSSPAATSTLPLPDARTIAWPGP